MNNLKVPVPIRFAFGKEGVGLGESYPIKLSGEPKWNDPGKLTIFTAVTGAFFKKDENPGQPYTTEEILKASMESVEAGASCIHVHVRDPVTGEPSAELELFRKVINPLREKYPRIVIDGGLTRGKNFEELMKPAREGLADSTHINPTATYWGDSVAVFPPQLIKAKTKACQELGVKVGIGVYDTAEIENAERWLIRTGILEKPYWWTIVPSLPGCASATNYLNAMENLIFMTRRIREIDPDSVIVTCSAGRATNYLVVGALVLGHNGVRVGMEDTIFKYPFSDEKIESNVDEVRRIVRIAEDMGREIATPDDHRKILGMK